MKPLRVLLAACLFFVAACGNGSSSSANPAGGKLYVNLGIITHSWTWLLLRGNQAFFGPGTMPEGGVDGFNPDAYAAKNPGQTATCERTGGKLVLTYKNGKKEERKCDEDAEGGLLLDGMPWALMRPLGDGTPLDGSYNWSLTTSTVAVGVTTTFERSGKFVERVVSGVMPSDTRYWASGDKSHAGTYSVKDYTLTMKYDDGKTETHAVGTMDKGASSLYWDADVRTKSSR